MTRVVVQTSVKLNPLGWFGGALFVFAPITGTLLAQKQMEEIARTLRYLSTASVNYSGIWTTLVVSGAVAAAGLVMVLVGREYVHDVQTVRPDDGKP